MDLIYFCLGLFCGFVLTVAMVVYGLFERLNENLSGLKILTRTENRAKGIKTCAA